MLLYNPKDELSNCCGAEIIHMMCHACGEGCVPIKEEKKHGKTS